MKIFRDDFQFPKLRKPGHLGAKFGILVDVYLIIYWLAVGVSCAFFHYHMTGFQVALAILNSVGVAIHWLTRDLKNYYDKIIRELAGN